MTALAAALGPKVDDVIGAFDDVHVVLDDDDRMSLGDEGVESLQEGLDVVEMESRRRLVEHEDRRLLFFLPEIVGELDALVFAAGERG